MSGAQTRFNNDLKRGAQMQLGPGGMAASNAFRPNHSVPNAKPSGAPVGSAPSNPPHPLQGETFAPQGAPQRPPGAGVNSDDIIGRLVQEIQFNKLLQSPEMHEANELENFRAHMQNKDIQGPERGARVLARLSSYVQ